MTNPRLTEARRLRDLRVEDPLVGRRVILGVCGAAARGAEVSG